MKGQKEMTAPIVSVGADTEQSQLYNSTNIIPQTAINSNIFEFHKDSRGEGNLSSVPESVKTNGLFCSWRYEDRNGRKTKVPYNPITGFMAKSNSKDSFEAFEKVQDSSGYDGIGLGIFNGICAIDLDNCVSDSGYYSETAADVVSMMHSYTEFSPSGNGLHILFFAKNFKYDTKKFYIMNHKVGIEVYVAGATNKYVTLTGNKCEDYDFGDRTKELESVLNKYMLRPENTARNAINAVNSKNDLEKLVEKAKASKNGDKFSSLWSGSIEGYLSHSEADMALCSKLAFWTGRDPIAMDELFRKSGLMRNKWDRAQSGTTYGAITIQKAIENCKEIYEPKEETAPQFPNIVPLTPQWSDMPKFPIGALPDVIEDYVKAVSENSQTSVDMAAVIGLGVLAVCLQGKYKVEGSPGYYEPLSLYTVVIAPPGERKSSVMRSMTKFLYEYEEEFNKSRSNEIRENHAQREALELRISGLQKKMEKNITESMEQELGNLKDELDALPKMEYKRFFADDCSSEALTSLLAKNNGVFSVMSTEGGIFDIMSGRYSSKSNIDVWLKGHCGDSIYVDRMSRTAEYIEHPALSAILSIQPSVLEEIMTNTTMNGRGLIARFLYSSPPSRIGTRVFNAPAIPMNVQEDYRHLIYRLMSIPVKEECETLRLSDRAMLIMTEYFEEHEKFLAGEGQAISDWASKYIGTVLRLAGLIHAVEMEENQTEISALALSDAIEIGKYFLAHAMYAYSMMGTDLSIQKANFVIAKLKKKNITEIKRSELFGICRGKFFKKTEDIFPTLDLLESHGYVIIEEKTRHTAGRPPDLTIRVNPSI